MLKVLNFRYVQSTPAYLKQGVQNYATPHRAVAGGNGTFIIAGDPPQVIIYYTDSNNTMNCLNVYNFIKMYTDRKRITEKYARTIFNSIAGRTFESERKLYEAILKAL